MIRRAIQKWRNRRAIYKLAKVYLYIIDLPEYNSDALDIVIHALIELEDEYEAIV